MGVLTCMTCKKPLSEHAPIDLNSKCRGLFLTDPEMEMPKPMMTPPTEGGWYWMKKATLGMPPQVLNVIIYPEGAWVVGHGWAKDMTHDPRWSGPIPNPFEGK